MASKARSASNWPQFKPSMRTAVLRRSWACPGSRRKSIRLPGVSVRTAKETGLGRDTLVSSEHLTSGLGADRLTGSTEANRLTSGAGNDGLRAAAVMTRCPAGMASTG